MVKNLPASAGDVRDMGLIPGWVRSPGEGRGNPFQYSCLENVMEELGGLQSTGRKESDMTECLHFTSLHFTLFNMDRLCFVSMEF